MTTSTLSRHSPKQSANISRSRQKMKPKRNLRNAYRLYTTDGLFSFTSNREQAILIAETFAWKYRILVRGADGDIIHDTGRERVQNGG